MNQPFDARQALLVDRGRPLSDWRTVSLVVAIRGALLLDPTDFPPGWRSRTEGVLDVVEELTARGLDGDSLVRYGLGPEIITSLLDVLLGDSPQGAPGMSVVVGADGFGPSFASAGGPGVVLPELAARWKGLLPGVAALGASEGEGGNRFGRIRGLVRDLTEVALPWILTAPLLDLIQLNPPTATQTTLVHNLIPDQELLEEYRWAVERLSITHLSDWSTSSLHLEHRWKQGTQPAACCLAEMDDRDVDLTDLQAEIAQRAASGASVPQPYGPAGMSTTLSAKMYSQAVKLLEASEFKAAASLFEFALSESPHDAAAANNAGFCLLPEAPHEALKYLELATTLRFSHPQTNLYNRALCLVRVGEGPRALRLIEDEWRDGADESAVLWAEDGTRGLKLVQHADVQKSLANLAMEIAVRLGLREAAKRWRQLAA